MELDSEADATSLLSRRNALPDVLDENVTKVSAGTLVNTLTKLRGDDNSAGRSNDSGAELSRCSDGDATTAASGGDCSSQKRDVSSS